MSVVAMILVLSLSAGASVEPCDAACERSASEKLIANGELRAAIERLGDAVDRYPDDPALPLVLARAYILDGNLFWAERTLRAALVRQPANAEPNAWLALVHLRQGDPDLAREVLSAAPEPSAGPDGTRHALLSAYLASLSAGEAEARTILDGIGHRAPAFAEDRPAWEALKRQLDPWWIDPISGRLEIIPGATSNALAGAPTDPGGSGTSSGILDAAMQLRIAPPLFPSVRPALDLEADGHFIRDAAHRELSSLEGSSRLGALVSRGRYRALVVWRAEALYLDQTPSLYAEADRGEIELESAAGWVVFGGAGHRVYRDARRTRNEWDAGGGLPVRLTSGRVIAVGATIRGASASSPAYDLAGASLAASTRLGDPSGLTTRISLTATWDDYPHSGGPEGALVFGTDEKRRDLSGKLEVELLLPPRHGVSCGLEVQLAIRDSTADDRPGFDFDYNEVRVGLVIRYGFRADPAAPRAVETPGHVPLEWGLGASQASEAESIIELLRQDEELRRGSSCGI